MNRHVDVEALNLRSHPKIAPENRIGLLHLGQSVEVVDGIDDEWIKVRASVEGKSQTGFVKSVISASPATGFVSKPSLRAPVSPAREAVAAEAIRQWLRFEQGQGPENVEPFFRFVGEMWSAIGQSLDGKDTDVPWSAAAISFMVRGAGSAFSKYNHFKFAAAHSKYMHDSIVKRSAGDTSAPYWGFQLHEASPQIGDIVGKWREVPRTFHDAVVSDSFKSHSDIIVSVSPDFVLAIGGNVHDSVGITRYAKEPSGRLSSTGGVIMLMVNRV